MYVRRTKDGKQVEVLAILVAQSTTLFVRYPTKAIKSSNERLGVDITDQIKHPLGHHLREVGFDFTARFVALVQLIPYLLVRRRLALTDPTLDAELLRGGTAEDKHRRLRAVVP